ncbi:hypothetical protein BS47DRAFT_1354829 [Hydnum rufescens UP504]|uniref:Uncharacterized protein n=1 Tax=Hydnum rufescens UP504 TaxID=1448309 RepID=A0A9P6AFD9_9AGAM|nr:hypothetical protein BS47DRAFT_1354829 [Hydnum rufescens UP504]
MSHKEWANVSKVIQIKSTAADCIKVKAYPMKQQRELLVISKVTANKKQTDKVARITGDVEMAGQKWLVT